MIDNFAILFSIGAVFFVTLRAAFLDRKTPWLDKTVKTNRQEYPRRD